MEPIAASSGPAARLGSGSGGDASALLRQGRILSAEVLARSPDGTVQLAIGRFVVPAKTELRMDAGTKFLVRVTEEGGEPVLNLVPAPAEEGGALAAALRGAIGSERPLGELLGELAAALRAAAELPPAATELARALPALVATPETPPSGAGLRALLAALGFDHEALLAAGADAVEGERLARPRADLKALLLRALLALGDGAGEDEPGGAVRRALAGLEAEQLLNVARARTGEPLVLAFPFPDGERWATARLAVPPRGRDGRAQPDEPEAFRVALELELTRLGPLRADLALSPGHLALRLTVASAETARRIEPELARLRDALSGGTRGVDVAVRTATRAEVERGFQPLDVRWLREHPLVDLAG